MLNQNKRYLKGHIGFVLAVIFLLLVIADSNASAQDKYVILYEHPNYTGDSLVIHEGTNLPVMPPGWNYEVSSIRVYNGAVIYGYLREGYASRKKDCISTNVPDMRTRGFDDQIMSLRWVNTSNILLIL